MPQRKTEKPHVRRVQRLPLVPAPSIKTRKKRTMARAAAGEDARCIERRHPLAPSPCECEMCRPFLFCFFACFSSLCGRFFLNIPLLLSPYRLPVRLHVHVGADASAGNHVESYDPVHHRDGGASTAVIVELREKERMTKPYLSVSPASYTALYSSTYKPSLYLRSDRTSSSRRVCISLRKSRNTMYKREHRR